MHRHADEGGLIVSGLLRTVAWLSLFCVLAFDAGGIVTNRVLLDEATRVAAMHAAEAAREINGRRAGLSVVVAGARAAAEESMADQPGITLVDVRVENGEVVVVARRRARVIVAASVPPLKHHVEAEAVSTASLAP